MCMYIIQAHTYINNKNLREYDYTVYVVCAIAQLYASTAMGVTGSQEHTYQLVSRHVSVRIGLSTLVLVFKVL